MAAAGGENAAEVSDVDKMFSRGRLLASRVNNQYRGDDNSTIVARCKHFVNLVQKYEKDVSIQYWVDHFKKLMVHCKLHHNANLILSVLLMKLNIATQIGRQVNDKHSALVKAKFDELLAQPRAVVNGAVVDAQTHYDNAENVANGNEAAREYVVTLLKFVLSVRSHQDFSRLDNKWKKLKMEKKESVHDYFFKVQELAHLMDLEGNAKSETEQVRACIEGLPTKVWNKSKEVIYDLSSHMRMWWEEAKDSNGSLDQPMSRLQKKVTRFIGTHKLKLAISDDRDLSEGEIVDSDAEEEPPKKKTKRFKDNKGKNGKGDKKGDQRSKEERTKPRDQLLAVVDAIDDNLMDNVPCEICKRRGRAQYGTRHNARQCNDNPRGSNFEPWFGFDRHGNRKGSKAAKDAWLKRKADVVTTSGSGSGSSSKTITFRSEDDLEKEVERRTSLKRVREKQEQEKFTRMMDTYNSSRGTVTVNRDDLAKLRRSRAERNASLGQDIEDESKWVFDPVTGVRI